MERKLKPLTGLGILIALVMLRFRRGDSKEELQRRIDLTRKQNARRAVTKAMNKRIRWECKHFWVMAQNTFIRLGEAHISRGPDLGNQGKRVRRPKVHKIQVERGFYRDEMIWYKIQVNKRQLWSTKNTLPYGVSVANALSKEMLFELSMSLNRVCTAKIDDPRVGAWLIVHRLEGFDGLQLHLKYEECLPHFPLKDLPKAPIMLGYQENQVFRTITLAEYPHILIAGTSGSGKSTWLNQMLCSWFRFADPAQLRIVLVDLKKMEFGAYADMPHLLEPTITDPENTIRILQFAVDEVLARAEILSAGKVKELTEWNRRHQKKRIPRIVIVIDEFAELMLGTSPEVRNAITILVQRLVNLGRAVGVHLVIATQRPAVEVLPNKIKINMGLVLCGRVPSATQSITIVGTGAAARLPVVAGRMVYLAGSDIHQIQTPHILEGDVDQALAVARGRYQGVIELDGWEAIINSDGLFLYVVDCLGGILKPENLGRRLQPLGVPIRGLRTWLIDTLSNREIRVIGDRSFEVVKDSDFYRIVEIIPEYDPVIFHFDSPIPALAPPRVLLLTSGLPEETEYSGRSESNETQKAGDSNETQSRSAQASTPNETQTTRNAGTDHPLTWDKDRLLSEFILARCDSGHGMYRVPKAQFITEFLKWAAALDPAVILPGKPWIGRTMSKLGIPTGTIKRIEVYRRIRLKPEFIIDPADAINNDQVSPIDNETESENE